MVKEEKVKQLINYFKLIQKLPILGSFLFFYDLDRKGIAVSLAETVEDFAHDASGGSVSLT